MEREPQYPVPCPVDEGTRIADLFNPERSSAGSFRRPIVDESTGKCIGVETKDGARHLAERVIMATGAWTPSLVDLKGQCVSKASFPRQTRSVQSGRMEQQADLGARAGNSAGSWLISN